MKNYIWHRIASLWELENNFPAENEVMPFDALERTFCIGRKDGQFYVLDDKCPHAGGSIGTGWCDTNGNVICPYHRIGFRLKDGGPASGKGYYVNSYPSEIREDGFYIGIKKPWWKF